MRAVFALLFFTFLLTGCGQKGDLFLPENSAFDHHRVAGGFST
ncbi:LPS translocon maturation chaperone LptM [Candidatus Sororendozoicomonas aggregata]